MSTSWQEVGGTHGGDSSRYIGQPGSCFTPPGTARHRGSVNIAGKPGSCSTKKVSWAPNSRPTYCVSSSIIYIKRCLLSRSPTVLLCRPHNTSADGLDAERIQACSLKVYIHSYLLTNSGVCLRHFIPLLCRSFVASAPMRIQLHREHIFYWFHIMGLKCFPRKLLQREESGLLFLMSAYSRCSTDSGLKYVVIKSKKILHVRPWLIMSCLLTSMLVFTEQKNKCLSVSAFTHLVVDRSI